MKIKIRRDYLKALLDKASAVSTAHAPINACKTFLLEVEKIDEKSHMLHIMRTDTKLSVLIHSQEFKLLDHEEPVRVLIPSDHLYELVQSLDTDEVELETIEGGGVKIHSGSYSGEWFTYSIKDFPPLPKLDKDSDLCFEVSAKEFVRDVERVKDLLPPVVMHLNEPWIRFTDSGECWVYDGDRHQRITSSSLKREFAVPKNALDVIRFIKVSGMTTVVVGRTQDFWYCEVGDDLFICQIQFHAPPTIEFIHRLDRANQGYFDFETAHLQKAVERIGITSGESKNITFEVKEKELILASGTGEEALREKSQETLPIQFMGNSRAKKVFAVNWQYFVQSLKVLGVASARMFVDIGINYIVLKSDDSRAVIPMLKPPNPKKA